MAYCANKKRNILEHTKAVMLLTLLMFSPILQAESSDNADASDSAAKAESAADQQQDFKFPAWPERRQQATNRQMVPPPPPGPYMSSALSDLSVKGSSFGINSEELELNQPVPRVDSSNVPMETFSPDRPWPEQHAYKKHKNDCPPACSPSRWMPENGYQYVKPGSMKMPDMNWPGSRLPSVGKAPDGPYPYAPNYAPTYAPGNDFAPRYNAPMN